MRRIALLLFPLLALAPPIAARAEDPAADAFAERLAVRFVPVPDWLVGEAPDWIDPDAAPPDLPWKDLKRAPEWSAFVRTNEAPMRTAARFRDEELLPLLRREAGLPLPDGTPFKEDVEALAERIFAEAWEEEPQPIMPLSDLANEATRLANAGCSNPVVAFVQGMGRRRKADAPWPGPGPARPAFSELLRTAVGQERSDEALAEFVAAAGAWCGSLAGRPEESRAALRFLSWVRRSPSPAPEGLAEALERSGADPWLVHLVRAYRQNGLAWRSRGGGYAASVTAEGWRGFYEHLSEAWREAVEAFRVHPEFPEAARTLLELCETGGGAGGDLWFARALEAEADSGLTFGVYRDYSCRPRWGGSIARMERLGRACHATHRHDTMVPGQFVSSLVAVAGEEREPWLDVLSDGKALGRSVEVLSALATNANAFAASRGMAQVRLPLLLLRAGDLDAAVAAQRAREALAVSFAGTLGIRTEEIGFLDVLCGPNGAALVPFEKAWLSDGPTRAAAAALRDLSAREGWTAAERRHLLSRRLALARAFPDEFDPLEWIDCVPPTAPPPFPPDYEAEGVLVPENPNLTWRGPETRLGLQLGCGGEAAAVFGVDPAAGPDEWTVKLGDAKYPEKMETVARLPARGDGPFPFRVVQRGGLVSLWIDGQEILDGCDAVRRLADPDRTDCRVVLEPRDLKVKSLRFRAAPPAEERTAAPAADATPPE